MTHEEIATIRYLQRALKFLDMCLRTLSEAEEVGALRDAEEWVEAAAREVAALIPEEL